MTIRRPWSLVVLLALCVSLAANLFVIGAWAGKAYGRHDRRMEAGVQHLSGRLAPPAGDIVRNAFAAHRDELTARNTALRAARGQVLAALHAEPFDPAALRTAFAELRARTDAAQAMVHGILADAAAELPADARSRWNPVGGPRRDR